jgi:hypothetical protein
MVDTTLRFLIEQVGGAEGAYPPESAAAGDFLARRAAGNAVEMLGVVAFRASPGVGAGGHGRSVRARPPPDPADRRGH